MEAHIRALPAGTIARLTDAGGALLGAVAFNPHTLIAGRILSPDPAEVIDQAFLERRLRSALHLRGQLFDRPFYRLVHAEADGLPGLVIDRFGDSLTIQTNAAWIDDRTDMLIDALDHVLQPAAIALANDSSARQTEGLPTDRRWLRGGGSPVVVEENGAYFFADPSGGQKTGWFYDQRNNRQAVAQLARGRTVLDVFAYAGGFGILSAIAGASQVTLVDRSSGALELATAAAERNGVAGLVQTVRADAFATLEAMAGEGRRFGIVIADPPAFVRSRRDLGAGLKGYRKLARQAAALVEPGGFLLMASCSHNVDLAAFTTAVAGGLSDAGRSGCILLTQGAGPDHPVHPHLSETAYLKALLLAVTDGA